MGVGDITKCARSEVGDKKGFQDIDLGGLKFLNLLFKNVLLAD